MVNSDPDDDNRVKITVTDIVHTVLWLFVGDDDDNRMTVTVHTVLYL